MSSNSRSALYSSFSSHIRSELQPAELSRATAALERAIEARRSILKQHRATPDDVEEAKREIEEIIADPSDMGKLKRLFCSPINLLPPDMKYDARAGENAKEYFRARTAELQAGKYAPQTPKSPCLDSIEDFDAWRQQLRTMDPKNVVQDHQTKPIREVNLELKSDIEQSVKALERFQNKFVSMDKELSEMPDELNEEVHEKIRALSKIVGAVNEFIQLKTTIVESASKIDDSTKTVPAARNNEIIDNIICQVENYTFSAKSLKSIQKDCIRG